MEGATTRWSVTRQENEVQGPNFLSRGRQRRKKGTEKLQVETDKSDRGVTDEREYSDRGGEEAHL